MSLALNCFVISMSKMVKARVAHLTRLGISLLTEPRRIFPAGGMPLMGRKRGERVIYGDPSILNNVVQCNRRIGGMQGKAKRALRARRLRSQIDLIRCNSID